MNDELPMGAQVIVPPGDNEHIMQAAIAAAQMHANRRRDTRDYEQAVATPPSWLHAGVPEAPPTEPPDWRQDAEREYCYNAHKYGGWIRLVLKYLPYLFRTLRRQHDLHGLRV